jgi:hypothetical protein
MKKINYYLILFFIIVVIITDLVNKKSFYFRTITDSIKYFGYFNGVNYTYGYMENSGALVYEKDP